MADFDDASKRQLEQMYAWMKSVHTYAAKESSTNRRQEAVQQAGVPDITSPISTPTNPSVSPMHQQDLNDLKTITRDLNNNVSALKGIFTTWNAKASDLQKSLDKVSSNLATANNKTAVAPTPTPRTETARATPTPQAATAPMFGRFGQALGAMGNMALSYEQGQRPYYSRQAVERAHPIASMFSNMGGRQQHSGTPSLVTGGQGNTSSGGGGGSPAGGGLMNRLLSAGGSGSGGTGIAAAAGGGGGAAAAGGGAAEAAAGAAGGPLAMAAAALTGKIKGVINNFTGFFDAKNALMQSLPGPQKALPFAAAAIPSFMANAPDFSLYGRRMGFGSDAVEAYRTNREQAVRVGMSTEDMLRVGTSMQQSQMRFGSRDQVQRQDQNALLGVGGLSRAYGLNLDTVAQRRSEQVQMNIDPDRFANTMAIALARSGASNGAANQMFASVQQLLQQTATTSVTGASRNQEAITNFVGNLYGTHDPAQIQAGMTAQQQTQTTATTTGTGLNGILLSRFMGQGMTYGQAVIAAQQATPQQQTAAIQQLIPGAGKGDDTMDVIAARLAGAGGNVQGFQAMLKAGAAPPILDANQQKTLTDLQGQFKNSSEQGPQTRFMAEVAAGSDTGKTDLYNLLQKQDSGLLSDKGIKGAGDIQDPAALLAEYGRRGGGNIDLSKQFLSGGEQISNATSNLQNQGEAVGQQVTGLWSNLIDKEAGVVSKFADSVDKFTQGLGGLGISGGGGGGAGGGSVFNGIPFIGPGIQAAKGLLHGKIPGFATGGTAPPGMREVGEQGYEFESDSGGSNIYSHGTSVSMSGRYASEETMKQIADILQQILNSVEKQDPDKKIFSTPLSYQYAQSQMNPYLGPPLPSNYQSSGSSGSYGGNSGGGTFVSSGGGDDDGSGLGTFPAANATTSNATDTSGGSVSGSGGGGGGGQFTFRDMTKAQYEAIIKKGSAGMGRQSDLLGPGQYESFIEGAKKGNLDPYFALAAMQQETHFGADPNSGSAATAKYNDYIGMTQATSPPSPYQIQATSGPRQADNNLRNAQYASVGDQVQDLAYWSRKYHADAFNSGNFQGVFGTGYSTSAAAGPGKQTIYNQISPGPNTGSATNPDVSALSINPASGGNVPNDVGRRVADSAKANIGTLANLNGLCETYVEQVYENITGVRKRFADPVARLQAAKSGDPLAGTIISKDQARAGDIALITNQELAKAGTTGYDASYHGHTEIVSDDPNYGYGTTGSGIQRGLLPKGTVYVRMPQEMQGGGVVPKVTTPGTVSPTVTNGSPSDILNSRIKSQNDVMSKAYQDAHDVTKTQDERDAAETQYKKASRQIQEDQSNLASIQAANKTAPTSRTEIEDVNNNFGTKGSVAAGINPNEERRLNDLRSSQVSGWLATGVGADNTPLTDSQRWGYQDELKKKEQRDKQLQYIIDNPGLQEVPGAANPANLDYVNAPGVRRTDSEQFNTPRAEPDTSNYPSDIRTLIQSTSDPRQKAKIIADFEAGNAAYWKNQQQASIDNTARNRLIDINNIGGGDGTVAPNESALPGGTPGTGGSVNTLPAIPSMIPSGGYVDQESIAQNTPMPMQPYQYDPQTSNLRFGRQNPDANSPLSLITAGPPLPQGYRDPTANTASENAADAIKDRMGKIWGGIRDAAKVAKDIPSDIKDIPSNSDMQGYDKPIKAFWNRITNVDAKNSAASAENSSLSNLIAQNNTDTAASLVQTRNAGGFDNNEWASLMKNLPSDMKKAVSEAITENKVQLDVPQNGIPVNMPGDGGFYGPGGAGRYTPRTTATPPPVPAPVTTAPTGQPTNASGYEGNNWGPSSNPR